jgi:SNF2 family DNA or RNA helicase
MVTTYETLMSPRDFNSVFKSIPHWEVLVVDEGQRCRLLVISSEHNIADPIPVKNDHGLLFKKLNELHMIHCVIMTAYQTQALLQ